MDSPSAKGRGAVVVAGVLVVLATALFVAVFYMFDGVQVLSALSDSLSATRAPSQSQRAAASDELTLPDGMPQEFALLVWEEQAQSQRAIRPLAEGEVSRLRILKVKVDGERATIDGTLDFRDGTKAPGVIGLHRFGDTWYVAYVSVSASTTENTELQTPKPAVSEVDSVLLSTVIAQQKQSGSVTQGIVDGRIREIRAGDVKVGPKTATIPVVLVGDSGETEAELIAIETEFRGDDFWFLARFNEAGTSTP